METRSGEAGGMGERTDAALQFPLAGNRPGYRLAKELDDFELVDSFEREWRDLEELAEDLQTVKLIIELYARRSVIEALLEDAQPDEPPQPFPELTPEYLERLRKLVTGEI